MKPVIIPIEQSLHRYNTDDRAKLQRALAIVYMPLDNTPVDDVYYPQSVEIASILINFHVDVKTTLAAILSDSRLNTPSQQRNIATQFGDTVANLVKDVNWLNTVGVYSPKMAEQPEQAEMLRQMLLSMTKDVRAVLIKLAYRIHQLRNLATESQEIRHFIAQETLDIYAPIANRLGVYQFKWELEDLAFRYLDTVTYRQIAQALAANRSARESSIQRFILSLRQVLAKEDIPSQCYGRPKHIYSIWKKMQSKKVGIEGLFDLLAVRVVVETLTQCYTVLGIVHSLWDTLPNEFDDYIANPKENGYESLHAVVLDLADNRIEVQIRTKAMHDYAELGVAAHWSYKEGGRQSPTIEKSIATLRHILESKEDNSISKEQFHSELFDENIYVLTPKGRLVRLNKGSTPLDFAYTLHTNIGHRCRGARVNGRIVPLTYRLNSGEQVEILTNKEVNPNRNWIVPNSGYLTSTRAIKKVRNYFSQLQGNVHKASVTAKDNASPLLKQKESKAKESKSKNSIAVKESLPKMPNLCEVSVAGLSNIKTELAQCCSPVSGDYIIGYISSHSGVIVHKSDCTSISKLNAEKQPRLVSVTWGRSKSSHTVSIEIHAFNAQHLLAEVSQLLTKLKVHIFTAILESQPDLSAILNLTIQIENNAQLKDVLKQIKQLPTITLAQQKA